MAIEHCVINGSRCSKCCEVLIINENKSFREWSRYARRYGYPEDFPADNKIYTMLIKVSKRRAKKINPYLVGNIGAKRSYFKCKKLKPTGCSIYESRPSMCSGFPYYGRTKEEFKEVLNGPSEYREDCTYYVDLK